MASFNVIKPIVQCLCLKPKYPLRRQLLLSFGSIAIITILCSIVMAVVSSSRGGQIVKDNAREKMYQQVIESSRTSSQYQADILTERIGTLRSLAALITEIARDRIVGYPNEGWEDDLHVPFKDIETGRNIYPFRSPHSLPTDWNLDFNLNIDNLEEHFQERGKNSLFRAFVDGGSTASASFFFAGNCDPNQQDINDPTYLPNCTAANNDPYAGGVIKPSPYLGALSEKSADLSMFIKPLFEADPDVGIMYIFYHNAGAGAAMSFPAARRSGRESYVSIGCDWMRAINPYTGNPLATEDEIANCNEDGAVVNARNYNPMEREFCKDQALHPGETRAFGPYKGANYDLWWLTFGQAIFDRRTGNFIGCVALDLSLLVVEQLLKNSIVGNHTSASVVSTEGVLVAGGGDGQQGKNVWETDLLDLQTYNKLTGAVDWTKEWDAKDVRSRLANNAQDYKGHVVSAYPVPVPPEDAYDPTYSPDFYIIITIDGEVFQVIDEIDMQINDDVNGLIVNAIIIGGVGLFLVVLFIWFTSRTLTLPLQWMEKISEHIVNHTYKDGTDELRTLSLTDQSNAEQHSNHRNISSSNNTILAGGENLSLWCTPSTEINSLVFEFRKMIRGFSGKGASTVARMTSMQEIQNILTWQSEFGDLYVPRGSIPSVSLSSTCQQVTVTGNGTGEAVAAAGAITYDPTTEASADTQQDVTNNVAIDEPINLDNPNEGVSGSNPNEASNHSESDSNPGVSDEDPPVSSPDRPNKEKVVFVVEDGDTHLPPRPSPQSSMGKGILRETSIGTKKAPVISNAPEKKNHGKNLSEMINEGTHPEAQSTVLEDTRPTSSSLFWWIVTFIAVPLIATNIIICTVVSWDLLKTFPSWINRAEDVSYELEVNSLIMAALLRASYAENVMREPMRDLYLLTRIAGYVIGDVVNRTDSFTETEISHVEECKHYPKDGSCPFVNDESRYLCDCAWEDLWSKQCKSYDFDTRYSQRPYWFAQSTDADEDTGNRHVVTSYPEFSSYSPETTAWWYDPALLPGAESGSRSRGYRTTYDRLRTQAAMAPVLQPLYNYATTASNLNGRSSLGVYFAFDHDGGFWGYDGCEVSIAYYSYFQSNDENEAYKIRPELCPKGKFGYDARCRTWYESGTQSYFDRNEPLYITAPYKYASTGFVGMSSGSAIVHPDTQELIGQPLLDFVPGRIIRKLLNETSSYFAFVVTPRATTENGADTVVGPGFQVGDDPKPIADVVLPHDPVVSTNRIQFDKISKQMKTGLRDTTEFKRMKEDGTMEDLLVSFAPVSARSLRPARWDTYERGAFVSSTLVFSLAVAERLETLKAPFYEIEDDIDEALGRLTALYIALVVIVTVLCIMFTAQVSVAITKPMIVLLRVVQNINDGKIDEELPAFRGGSAEANHVYGSFAKLYKIVRIANKAFFSGDLRWAYDVVYDAMRLFRKVNDQKAIGVVCNNLGSTLFALSCERDNAIECRYVNGVCCVKSAVKYLTESIEIGKTSLERFNSEEVKAAYAFQLADRHFNRAMCLLVTSSDYCCPRNFKEMAYVDLQKAQQLEAAAKDIWVKKSILLQNSDVFFERLVRRIHGLALILHHHKEVCDIWNVADLAEEANAFLSSAWEEVTLPIFEDMDRVGRLQQLEGAVMNLELSMGNDIDASKIGIRMLAEDEYMIDTTYAVAAESLLRYGRNERCSWTQETSFRSRCDLLGSLKSCKGGAKTEGKTLIFCFEISDRLKDHYFLKSLNKGCLALYDDACASIDYVGVIAFGSKLRNGKIEEMYVKDAEKAKLRRRVDSATSSTSGHDACAALPLAAQMVDDANILSGPKETYLLFITDGSLWNESELDLMLKEMERHNGGRPLHVICIGLELQDDAVVGLLKKLCQKSPSSIYIDCDRNSISGVLDRVCALVSARNFFDQASVRLGITMEKF